MNRSEAVSASNVGDNVFSIDRYSRIKKHYRIPDAKPKAGKTLGGKFLTDKERVAQVQRQNNNYKDHK